jgi:hypothetical protein
MQLYATILWLVAPNFACFKTTYLTQKGNVSAEPCVQHIESSDAPE